MSIEGKIENPLVREDSGIWRLGDHNSFAYSDGSHTERYLRSVLERDIDLSSGSSDLIKYIKDWPTEYHLSNKRAQLLSGFDFDPSLKVLEVGCGCGAITRHLAETFSDVVSIEGSPARARLAQLRTRDCDNVSIVCAPFQDLEFSEKFDLIICVGVLEYSASFVDEVDPYQHVVRYFSELLSPDGRVVIAIENQFGLKYFSSCREDHLKLMFEGIEGYPVFADKVRTFGRVELEQLLSAHFPNIKFYYPYPDYKIPDAVLSEEMLLSGHAGELVAGFASRDHYGPMPKLFDESLATLELARNELLPTFSHSFLVIAGKAPQDKPAFGQLGVMFSSRRLAQYRMQTRFLQDGRAIKVEKTLLHPDITQEPGLAAHPVAGPWIEGYSLHTRILLKCLLRKSNLADSFEVLGPWLDRLRSVRDEAALPCAVLPGNYIDCIWKNSFLANGEITFIDQEWEWQEKLSLEVLFIRSMFFFLLEIQHIKKLPRYLRVSNTRKLIRRVAGMFDLSLSNDDFASFCRQEADFQARVYG
ncbi:MAG: class I SAM-dependent methyltransferase, partial [Gammaproteobacteria bacterium]|nr:class I SAM-dependent methyltransferase [Gammaproteobacteria bacterium]